MKPGSTYLANYFSPIKFYCFTMFYYHHKIKPFRVPGLHLLRGMPSRNGQTSMKRVPRVRVTSWGKWRTEGLREDADLGTCKEGQVNFSAGNSS